MAKFETDEIGKPGKPPKARRFPWRLWLYALVMTAAAAYVGNYAWDARQRANTAGDEAVACHTDLGKAQAQSATDHKTAGDCLTQLAEKAKQNQDLQTQLTSLGGNLNASKDDLQAVRSARGETEKRAAVVDELQKQFARMGETGQLKVTARRGSLVLSLPADPLFNAGTAELTKPGELAVLEVGIRLKPFPDRRFLVLGHTDDTPVKSTTYKDNWELSAARALAVTRFLIQAGMDPKNLIGAGAGENDPATADRGKNRRIEIVMQPSANELPPLPASLGADTAAPPAKVEAEPAKPPAAAK